MALFYRKKSLRHSISLMEIAWSCGISSMTNIWRGSIGSNFNGKDLEM